jgi:hypothetical protein
MVSTDLMPPGGQLTDCPGSETDTVLVGLISLGTPMNIVTFQLINP